MAKSPQRFMALRALTGWPVCSNSPQAFGLAGTHHGPSRQAVSVFGSAGACFKFVRGRAIQDSAPLRPPAGSAFGILTIPFCR